MMAGDEQAHSEYAKDIQYLMTSKNVIGNIIPGHLISTYHA